MERKVFLWLQFSIFSNKNLKLGNQYWTVDEDGLIQHKSSLCLEILENKLLVMSACNKDNMRQKWTWKIKTR
jgi:hypothetical protein